MDCECGRCHIERVAGVTALAAVGSACRGGPWVALGRGAFRFRFPHSGLRRARQCWAAAGSRDGRRASCSWRPGSSRGPGRAGAGPAPVRVQSTSWSPSGPGRVRPVRARPVSPRGAGAGGWGRYLEFTKGKGVSKPHDTSSICIRYVCGLRYR